MPIAACTSNDHASPAGGTQLSAATASVQTSRSGPDPSPVRGTSAPVTGTVAETMEAASYTYVRLTTPQGDQWAAIPQAKLAIGDTVTVVNPMVIDGFKSPTLKRSFDHILFGTLAGQAPPAQVPRGNPHAGLLPGATASPEAPVGAPVPKATGADAHTVAEVFAAKSTLSDKSVSVRGRVTKFNPSILGKNWLHVEDGSGQPSTDGSIVVTTNATAAVGDVVLVQGTVRTNKDFGAGYSYPVIIDDATVTK